MSESDIQAISNHGDVISYSVYAEINHFNANRNKDFKAMMQGFLAKQIEFHKKVSFTLLNGFQDSQLICACSGTYTTT